MSLNTSLSLLVTVKFSDGMYSGRDKFNLIALPESFCWFAEADGADCFGEKNSKMSRKALI